MIIRSQNKAFIINFGKVDTVCLGGIEGKSVITFTDAQVVTLGEYSTEEKAIKVLDMVQATYERNKLFAITYKDGVLHRLEKCNGLEGTRELIGSVFQMPSDESVEV